VKQRPLDQPTYLRVKWLLEHARILGVDPVEYLHEAGLVMTPGLEQTLRIRGMEFLLAEIQGWRPAEFIRRTDKSGSGATVADLHQRICEFIQDHIDAAREGGT
jgi:hypothetical protein